MINVYPVDITAIKNRVDTIFNNYQYFRRVSYDKKKDMYWKKCSAFVADQNSMLDIIADSTSIKEQGGKWDVTMTDKRWKFLNNQSQNPPIGCCESFAERRWEIAQKRRQKQENRVHNQSFEESFQVADEADIQRVHWERKITVK